MAVGMRKWRRRAGRSLDRQEPAQRCHHFRILGVNTIDPQNRNVDRNFTITPGMFIPAASGAFDHHEMANPAMAGLSLQNEAAMIQQAKKDLALVPRFRHGCRQFQ